MQKAIETRIYEFNDFRLDVNSHRLFRRTTGELIPLTPKVAELLIYLAGNGGRILSKSELLDAVWEDAFVEESNLTQSVSVLRKVLGEDAKNPRFILTLPNRGYQFIAKVKEIHDAGRGDESERQRWERRGTTNSDAYQAYVRGRFFWNKRTGVSLKKAVENFEQAIEQDPNFAHAYNGLADCYQLLAEYYAAATPDDTPVKAKAALTSAIAVDGRLAEAHAGLAYAQAFYDWDWENAERSFKHALELNPNYATAHQWYADYLSVMGRFDEALSHLERAIEIDPTSPIVATGLAAYYYTRRSSDTLIKQAKKIIELDGEFAYGYFYLGFGYEFKKMYGEAVDAWYRAALLFGEPQECADGFMQAFREKGITGMWQKRFEQYDEFPHLQHYPKYLQALIPIRLGDKETTVSLLEEAFEQRDRGIIYAKHELLLASLRDDPRFQNLIRRIGL